MSSLLETLDQPFFIQNPWGFDQNEGHPGGQRLGKGLLFVLVTVLKLNNLLFSNRFVFSNTLFTSAINSLPLLI